MPEPTLLFRKLLCRLPLILLFFFTGCEDDSSSSMHAYNIKGVVQKGPFILGSTITIQELNNNYDPTGNSFITHTNDDFGAFRSAFSLSSRTIEIIASGYYFNEVSGNLSEGPLTLAAIVELTDSSNVNVNLLTTLTHDRILSLLKNGNLSFGEAKAQAEEELTASLNVSSSSQGFETLDITESEMLLGLSVIIQGKLSVANMAELLSKIARDIDTNGEVSAPLVSQLRQQASELSPAAIEKNLEDRYEELGLQRNIAGITDFLNRFLYSNARTFRVPADYTSIQSAVNAASPYDTIIVQPGLYAENISISKPIVVASSFIDHPNDTSIISHTILSAKSSESIITITNDSAKVIGFTVSDGQIQNPAIRCEKGNLSWLNVVGNAGTGIYLGSLASIQYSKVASNSRGGIVCAGIDSIYKTFIVDNASNYYGSAIFLTGSARVSLLNVTVANNRSSSEFPFAIHLGDVDCILKTMNCILWNKNISEIYHYSASDIDIQFTDSAQEFAGAGNLLSDPLFTISYSLMPGSPCINAGNPALIYSDADGSRNDLGATGNK